MEGAAGELALVSLQKSNKSLAFTFNPFINFSIVAKCAPFRPTSMLLMVIGSTWINSASCACVRPRSSRTSFSGQT